MHTKGGGLHLPHFFHQPLEEGKKINLTHRVERLNGFP